MYVARHMLLVACNICVKQHTSNMCLATCADLATSDLATSDVPSPTNIDAQMFEHLGMSLSEHVAMNTRQ